MSFCYNLKTLRSGTSYDSRAQPKMSGQEEEVTRELETDPAEGNEENSVRFSPNLVEEMIQASLESLHAQISALTEMMDRFIQCYSATETITAISPETRPQCEPSYSGKPGSSRFQNSGTTYHRRTLAQHGDRSKPNLPSKTTNTKTLGLGHSRRNSVSKQKQKGGILANIWLDRIVRDHRCNHHAA